MNLLFFFLLFGGWFCQLSLSYNFQVCWTKVTICSDNAGDQSGCYVETLFNGYQQGQSNVFVPDFSSSLFSSTTSCSNCCYTYGPSSTSLSVTFKVWDDDTFVDDLLHSYTSTSIATAGNWYMEGNDYTVCTERIDFTTTNLAPTPSSTTSSPTTPSPTSNSVVVGTPSPTYEPPADDLTLCYYILDNSDDVDRSIIGNGVCNTGSVYSYSYNYYGGSTSINDATCQYDGGDCCTATNYYYCKDPRYAASPTPQPTNGNSSDSTLYLVIAAIVVIIIIISIGGVLGFLYWKKKMSAQAATSNLDYQQMQHVETTNTSL